MFIYLSQFCKSLLYQWLLVVHTFLIVLPSRFYVEIYCFCVLGNVDLRLLIYYYSQQSQNEKNFLGNLFNAHLLKNIKSKKIKLFKKYIKPLWFSLHCQTTYQGVLYSSSKAGLSSCNLHIAKF